MHAELNANPLPSTSLTNTCNAADAREIVILNVWSSMFNTDVNATIDDSTDPENSTDVRLGDV